MRKRRYLVGAALLVSVYLLTSTGVWVWMRSRRPSSPPWPSLMIYAASAGDVAAVRALLKADPGLVSATSEPGDPAMAWRDSPAVCSYAPLHWAASNGHARVARILIARGADVDARALSGETPLHLAACQGETRVVDLLLAAGADPNAKDEEGTPPLHEAARYSRPERAALVRRLLEAGAETDIFTASGLGMVGRVKALLEGEDNLVGAKDIYGQTPLHWAARAGRVKAARLLLESGAEPEARDKHGRTPMELAVKGGYEGIVGLLIDSGADVEAREEHGWTPLWLAALYGHKAAAELLLARGADVNARGIQGWTPLHTAAGQGQPGIAELLIARGAEVNARTDEGWTPLHRAALPDRSNPERTARRMEATKILLANGAEVDAKDKDGGTPLCGAAAGNNLEMVQLLLENGADPNEGCTWGASPLHRAAEYGHDAVARLLLARGADANSRDDSKRTPLHEATRRGKADMVRLLLAHEADANARDGFGYTPLDFAEQTRAFKDEEVIELLRSHGGKTDGTAKLFRFAVEERSPPPLSEEALRADTSAVVLFGETIECGDLPAEAVRRVLDYLRYLEPWDKPMTKERFHKADGMSPEEVQEMIDQHNKRMRGTLVPKPGSPYPTSQPENSAARFCHNCLGEEAWVFFAICFRSGHEPLKALAVKTAVFWCGSTPSLSHPKDAGYWGGDWSKCIPHVVDGLDGLDAEARCRAWQTLFKEHITDERILRKMARAAHAERDPEVRQAAAMTMMNASPVKEGWEYYYVYRQ